MNKYDLVVIGAGSGGYVAAIRAAQLGARVAVIERDRLGGTCLNWGCIPTKTLVASAELLSRIMESEKFGIKVSDYEVDFPQMMKRKDGVVKQLVDGIAFLFKRNKIDLIQGEGKILDQNRIQLKKDDGLEEIETDSIIIATGSKSLILPFFNYDGEKVITSKEALSLEEIPESLLIVGAGVIGCEFASIYSTLGTKIIMVDVMPQILPTEDKSTAKKMERIFNKKGIEIKTKTKIEKIETDNNGIIAYIDDGSTIKAEKALISIGRKLVFDNLGLEDIGIEQDDKGAIVVNEKMETNIAGIYAVGDITNKVQLAHVASTQGIVAAENIMGKERYMSYNSVPACIFTNPEIASVGMSADDAKKAGIKVAKGRFTYKASGKALAMGEEEGMVTLIVDKESDKILGGQIMGAHASDLIAEITLAINNGLSSQQVAETIHAHPTLAETVMEAAESVHGLSIHG
jgi:dihydrolipoamide dehydrogenase